MGKEFRYFKVDEIKGLNENLVELLDKARGICEFPFIITSGYRTSEENKKIGGAPGSSHTKGLAVDLKIPLDEELVDKMKWALGVVGFRRIGIYDKHIHVDIDDEKLQYKMWHGISK